MINLGINAVAFSFYRGKVFNLPVSGNVIYAIPGNAGC